MNLTILLQQFFFVFLAIIGVLTVQHILIPAVIRAIKRERFSKRGSKVFDSIPKQKVKQKRESKPLQLSVKLIKSIEWKNFENLCCKFFVERGLDARVTSTGADGGVDINVYKKGSDTPEMIVQCKAYSKNVGVKDIREFYGVLSGSQAKRGIFITTSDFTSDAKNFAKDKFPELQLSSGERFMSLVKKLSPEAQQRLLNVATYGDYKTPTCASCDVKMVLRQGKNGNFFGCKNFPSCRTTMRIKV